MLLHYLRARLPLLRRRVIVCYAIVAATSVIAYEAIIIIDAAYYLPHAAIRCWRYLLILALHTRCYYAFAFLLHITYHAMLMPHTRVAITYSAMPHYAYMPLYYAPLTAIHIAAMLLAADIILLPCDDARRCCHGLPLYVMPLCYAVVAALRAITSYCLFTPYIYATWHMLAIAIFSAYARILIPINIEDDPS